MPEISVCILNWNTREQLRRCLQSLREHAAGLDVEVIVVDNASADASAQMVREEFPEVQLIANDQNVYYAAGNNQALERAQGEFVLLLNPDIVVTPGAIEELKACLLRHPRAGAVAPRLVYPDGRLQASCRTFPTPDVVFYEALGLSRLFPRSRRFGKYRMTWWAYDDERQVDQPMASALMLRRQALEEVGLFDEQFPMFFNDVDLCKRLKDAGWEIWFTPAATMIHEHGAATGQVAVRMALESYRSQLRFYAKHYRGRVNALSYWGALGLLTLGMVWRLPLAAWRQWRQRSRRRAATAFKG
ncbi:MAG: glycosyltransferase family 2 protein [Armatimonadetes bacterium]|nr:glycosyltransferase family 2 protein [Armatimonadota bacterium]